MKNKTIFLIQCICITFSLMFTIVCAEETVQITNLSELLENYDTSITVFYVDDEDAEEQNRASVMSDSVITNVENQDIETAIDLIEYDVTYTISTTDNTTTMSTIFTVTNNETDIKQPLLMVAMYDNNNMIGIKTAKPEIASGTTITEMVSITIPDAQTDNYCIKIFVWESTGSLRPLGKSKMINDIDPYLREKYIYVTKNENSEFKFYMNALEVKGENNDAIHTIEYDVSKIFPIDLCGFTYEKELLETEIPNTNILIDSVDFENGIIKYKFINNAGRNTGINNMIKFKALTDLTNEEIKYTIQ